jgi:uncharacterized protein
VARDRVLPMFPLESVLFPGSPLPLHVFEDRYRRMTRECLAGDRTFGVVLIERGREVGGGEVRLGVGTTAVIEQAAELPDGRFALICQGEARLRVLEWLEDDPYPRALVELLPEETPPDASLVAAAGKSVRHAWALLSELGADSPLGLEVTPDPSRSNDPAALGTDAWRWCALAPLSAIDQFELLRAEGHHARLGLLRSLTDAVAADVKALLQGGGGTADS